MQYAEESDLCTKVSRITSDFEQGFRTATKQEIVEGLLVLQGQRSQPWRECEDHMDIPGRQKLLPTCSEPTLASTCLTFRAVSVAARVVGDGPMPTASALIDMATECGGTTPRNGQQDFDMLPADPLTASFDEGISCSADEIGHLERWPAHLLILR
jgi:hypothetical protein